MVSRAERDVQAKFLLRNGADEVVYPEKQLAKWAAIRYSSEHNLDYIELQDDHAIMEVTIPPEWMDRTIGEIDIRKKYNINILALKKDGKLDMNITPDTRLCRDESMLVLGKYASSQKCFRLSKDRTDRMDVVLLLMVLGVMLSGFWAADALDHMRKEIIRQEGKRRGWWS